MRANFRDTFSSVYNMLDGQIYVTQVFSFLFVFQFLYTIMFSTEYRGEVEAWKEGYQRKMETLKWTGLTEVTNSPATSQNYDIGYEKRNNCGKTLLKAPTEILFIVMGVRSRLRTVQVAILVIAKYIGSRFCHIHTVVPPRPSWKQIVYLELQ